MGVTVYNADGSLQKNSLKTFGRDDVRVVLGTYQFDSVYAAGGEEILDSLGSAYFPINGKPEYVFFQPYNGFRFWYDERYGKVRADQPGGGCIFQEHHHDIKGCGDGVDHADADQAAAPTNGAAVCAETAVAGGAWAHPAITNPDCARSVVAVIRNDSGGALNAYVGDMGVVITGTFKGAAQTETIAFTVADGNKSIANTKYRFAYGSKPFETITNVTITHVPADGLKISIGLGVYIGVFNNIAADPVKIVKNAAHLAPTNLCIPATKTVKLVSLADGDDVSIWYKVPAEAEAGQSFATVDIPFIAIGR